MLLAVIQSERSQKASGHEEPAIDLVRFPLSSRIRLRFVTRLALKDDNRRKLGAAGTNKRHLAVYVFATNYSPWCGLVDCVPPTKTANLPSEITDLRLFTETRSSYESVV